MAERKSVKLFRQFTKKQNAKFNNFLASPYFNKNNDIIIVYNVLQKFLNSKDQDNNFIDYLLENCKKNGLTLNLTSAEKHLSNLFQLSVEFISIEKHLENNINKSLNSLEYFHENGEVENFDKLFRKVYKNITNKKESIEKLNDLYRLKLLQANFSSIHKDNKTANVVFQELTNSLDQFYISQKLFVKIVNLNIQIITNTNFETNFTKDVIKALENSDLLAVPLINCWYHVYLVITASATQKPEIFNTLLNLLEKDGPSFSDESLFNLYNCVHSYAALVYKNNAELYSFKFDLYKKQIKNKSIYHDNNILSQSVKNIVNVSIKQKEFDWLEEFLDHHKNKILPKAKEEDVYNYNYALLKFHQKDFKETQELIIRLNFKNIFYKISAKRLELMLYFEMKEWLFLDSLINAFRVGLTPKRSESFPKIHKTYNLNFIKYFHKLFVLYNSPKVVDDKMKKLKQEIQSIKEISEKDWLLEKLG